MSNVCSSCGSTGGLSQTCATKLSQIVWDGGSMCNGYSGTSVIDAILSLSQSICNLNTEFTSFAVTSDDVTYTTTSAVLTGVLDTALAAITALQSDIATLDGTLVLKHDNVVSTYDSAGTTTYGDLKSYTVPADTFNATDEYLLIELHIRTAYSGTYGNAKFRVTLDSQTIIEQTLSSLAASSKNPVEDVRVFVIPIRVSSSATNGDYHGYSKKPGQYPVPMYGFLTATAGLTFTGTLPLKVQGYNTTGVVACDLIRVTKVRKNIIY